MASERDAAPLMWVNGLPKNNVIVLTKDTLFLATFAVTELARIDKALEDGVPAGELLPAKAWKIPFEDIQRIQYKHARIVVHQAMNKDATVYYRDAKKSRSLLLAFSSPEQRDEVVGKLNERLGSWPFTEEDEPAWRILIRYLWIMVVIGLLMLLATGLLISGVITEAPVIIAWYLNLCGICSAFPPGLFFLLIVLVTGIRQLRTPPLIVTYAPDK